MESVILFTVSFGMSASLNFASIPAALAMLRALDSKGLNAAGGIDAQPPRAPLTSSPSLLLLSTTWLQLT